MTNKTHEVLNLAREIQRDIETISFYTEQIKQICQNTQDIDKIEMLTNMILKQMEGYR